MSSALRNQPVCTLQKRTDFFSGFFAVQFVHVTRATRASVYNKHHETLIMTI